LKRGRKKSPRRKRKKSRPKKLLKLQRRKRRQKKRRSWKSLKRNSMILTFAEYGMPLARSEPREQSDSLETL